MGSIINLVIVLAIVAGIGLVIFAAVRSVGSTPDKPWEGYTKPTSDDPGQTGSHERS